jgi:peptidoglycan/xylan/chitin deacetylase (PgdA/CDA1 family)
MSPLDFIVHALSRRPMRMLFDRVMHGRATIFMLHRLTNPASKIHGHEIAFVRQALRALRDSGARFVSVRELMQESLTPGGSPHGTVAFTIDDGFADQAELAREAFVAEGCPATIFLISGFLDGQLWPWDDRLSYMIEQCALPELDLSVGGERLELQLGSPAQRYRSLSRLRDRFKAVSNSQLYADIDAVAATAGVSLPALPPPAYRPMTWDQARALEPLGIDFAPHSVTHRIFSRLSDTEARAEISESWRRLQQELRNPLPLFAWPTGRASDYTKRDLRLLREAGLSVCASAIAGYAGISHELQAVEGVRDFARFPFPDSIRDVLQYGSWIERGKEILRGALSGR